MSARDIISQFGGIRPMADKLQHRNHTTVQGWWDRDIIPAHRQSEVLDAAVRHDVDVSAADMIRRESARSQEAPTEAEAA